MKALFIFIFWLGVSTSAFADESLFFKDWDSWDKTLYSTLLAGQVADSVQTNRITFYDALCEGNPLLAKSDCKPNMPGVYLMKTAVMGGIYWLVNDQSEASYRKTILLMTNIMQWMLVLHNHRVQVSVGVTF